MSFSIKRNCSPSQGYYLSKIGLKTQKPTEVPRQIIDSLGGFLTMIESAIDGNPRFTLKEIILEGWKIAFKETKVPHVSFQCILAKIVSELYLKRCGIFQIEPDNIFKAFYCRIQYDLFEDLDPETQQEILSKLLKHLNQTPITLTKESLKWQPERKPLKRLLRRKPLLKKKLLQRK